MKTQSKLIFALAGEVVSSSAHAKRILVDAIRLEKDWLIPQAESVFKQLRDSAQ